MTDSELKELVAGLATSNAENARLFKESDKKMLENAVAQAENARLFKESDKKFLENAAIQAENAAELRKTEEILKNLGIHVGGMANSHGQSTEEYFYNSLAENPRLGNIKFDEISRNLHYKIANLEDEFDITMFNGNNIALIECKYRAKEEDVIRLIDKKVGNFRKLVPFYANHTIYLGIASFSFDARLEKFAKDNGVAILRQSGDVVEVEADNLKAY